MPLLPSMEKPVNFDTYEKKLFDSKAAQMVAIEFYKSIVDYFGWEDRYGISSRFSDMPSMSISGLGSTDRSADFMFGNNTLRIRISRMMFVVSLNDKYLDVISKILEIVDYIEDDRAQEEKAIV